MGLIQMLKGAVVSNLQDQVVDLFEAPKFDNNTIAAPARKIVRSGTVNNATSDVITNGSTFNVAMNEAALLVENGYIREFVIVDPSHPELAGQYKYDSSVEPSLLGGGFRDLMPSIKNMGNRFRYGGQSGNVIRLYYIDLHPITGLPFGGGEIPFRDSEYNIDITVQYNGFYEIQIVDPNVFYQEYLKCTREPYKLDSDLGVSLMRQYKSEMGMAFQKTLGVLEQMNLRASQVGMHGEEITIEMNKILDSKWLEQRGIRLTNISFTEFKPDKHSMERITKIQEQVQVDKIYTDDRMLKANVARGFTQAANTAAANESGSMNGFLGFGMANMGMNSMMGQMGLGNTTATGPLNTVPQGGVAGAVVSNQAAPQANASQAPVWICSCGTSNTANFCSECGSKKPEVVGWTCTCGAVNQGKFCQNCGAKKPEGAPLYKCDKCGWVPEDPMNPPKFCPECGDKFDENDVQ